MSDRSSCKALFFVSMFCSSCGSPCEDAHVFCAQCGCQLQSTSSGMYAGLCYIIVYCFFPVMFSLKSSVVFCLQLIQRWRLSCTNNEGDLFRQVFKFYRWNKLTVLLTKPFLTQAAVWFLYSVLKFRKINFKNYHRIGYQLTLLLYLKKDRSQKYLIIGQLAWLVLYVR